MKYLILSIGILFSLIQCTSNEATNQHESKFINSHQLILKDSLSLQLNDSLYISRIKDFVVWNDRVLISDLDFKKVWIFDDKLNFINSIGGEGKGPSEFISVPRIVPMDDSLYLFDYQLQLISIYDDKYNFVRSVKYPKGYIIFPEQPISVDNKIAISGSPPFLKDKEKYFDLNSILILDKKMQFIKDLIKWDDYYKTGSAYSVYNMSTMLSSGKGSSFYSIQMATTLFNHIDINSNLISCFDYKPKNYKDPPEKKVEIVASSFEETAKFGAKTTRFHKMDFDKHNDLLLVNYMNLRKESWYQRSFHLGNHYLIIFNRNYNCIIDTMIPGPFAFTKNGNIYVLKEETPEFVRLYEYSIAKK